MLSESHRLQPWEYVKNGYIYYTPTAEQLKNRGGAQEDSDCMLAPEWQMIFEDKVEKILAVL